MTDIRLRALDLIMPQIATELRDLRLRVARLEAEKDATPGEKLKGLHKGTWRPGRSYSEGVFTTHSGSLWYATAPTSEKPGDGKTSWRLVVKRGAAESFGR